MYKMETHLAGCDLGPPMFWNLVFYVMHIFSLEINREPDKSLKHEFGSIFFNALWNQICLTKIDLFYK